MELVIGALPPPPNQSNADNEVVADDEGIADFEQPTATAMETEDELKGGD